MKILIKNLRLQNFKGIRHFEVNFNDVTNIYGANGTGKTTIFDAFLWLLFGKDSTDRSAFEIKTLDENNEPYHHLSHEVTATLTVDGNEVVLKKLYEEKWVKKTGEKTPTFSGHTNKFWWNDVPLNEKEYSQKIASFINEKQFKLLTNLSYFNTVMKWEERRAALLSIAGDIKDIDVAMQNNKDGELNHLIDALSKGKTVDEYKKEIAGKIRKIKEEIENVPARIAENRRSLPAEIDYSEVESLIESKKTELDMIESILLDRTESQKQRQEQVTAWMKEQNQIRQNLIALENNARNVVKDKAQSRIDHLSGLRRKLSSLQDEKRSLLSDYNDKSSALESLKKDVALLKTDKETIGKEWDAANALVFHMSDDDCVCPACKQPLPDAASKAEELKENFNLNKKAKIDALTQKGISVKERIEVKEKEITAITAELENIKDKGSKKAEEISVQELEIKAREEEHARLNSDEEAEIEKVISTDVKIADAIADIKKLNDLINAPYDAGDNTQLLSQKKELQNEYFELSKQLSSKEQRETILARIAELESIEEKSSSELAELEGLQFSLLQFDKLKMDMLEQRINGRFRMVSFKLFERTIDGSEKPACVALINGVPYPDANTASKINASLDIINVFSDHYNIKVPVFIDNRESVVKLIQSEMQIVNLFVSGADSKLRVESNQPEFAFS